MTADSRGTRPACPGFLTSFAPCRENFGRPAADQSKRQTDVADGPTLPNQTRQPTLPGPCHRPTNFQHAFFPDVVTAPPIFRTPSAGRCHLLTNNQNALLRTLSPPHQCSKTSSELWTVHESVPLLVRVPWIVDRPRKRFPPPLHQNDTDSTGMSDKTVITN